MIGLAGGKAEEGDDMLVRAREQQADLRAAVTAVLPVVAAGQVDSRDAISSALGAVGFGTGSDRDLALLAGALQSARAFVLLGECLGADPEQVWQDYLAMTG